MRCARPRVPAGQHLQQPQLGYVVAFHTFIAPERDAYGEPVGVPVLRSALKLGDGGQEAGYGAGKASGSIISRVVRSYWNDPNMYRGELLGIVVPGNDRNVSGKIAKQVGWDLRIRGDVWDVELLKLQTVDDLLALLEVRR